MSRITHAVAAMILSAPVWADSAPSNVTSTTWEIYGMVATVFIVGALWVVWYQKKENDREKRRQARQETRTHSAA